MNFKNVHKSIKKGYGTFRVPVKGPFSLGFLMGLPISPIHILNL